MKCRHCDTHLKHVFLDLGFSPPSNAYLNPKDLKKPEHYYPLKLYVCDECWLVQTEDYASSDELFNPNYAYFSSTSSGWLQHAKDYCHMAIQRFHLNAQSYVVEIAANDGYLLKNFLKEKISCLGIEPTDSTADAAVCLGVPIIRKFFGQQLAQHMQHHYPQADLIIGNNVYAHVPDINDFTHGLKTLLKPEGSINLEFPHLLNLIEEQQFDTVYHEHYSYLSLYTVQRIFKQAGLRIYDVERLTTHGGSLRVYACHQHATFSTSQRVTDILKQEQLKGLQTRAYYTSFQQKADHVKNALLYFLLEQHQQAKSVVAYGAAAKGNTLLNYAGIKPDLLPFVCDAAQAKQGMFMPGSHIPILTPDAIRQMQPDFVLILPWNIASEVIQQNAFIRNWGGRFVTAIPSLQIL